LGHASDVRGRYGRKGILDPVVAAKIEALEPAVIKQMKEILLGAKKRADNGEVDSSILSGSTIHAIGSMEQSDAVGPSSELSQSRREEQAMSVRTIGPRRPHA
jgi:hypothetical protein